MVLTTDRIRHLFIGQFVRGNSTSENRCSEKTGRHLGSAASQLFTRRRAVLFLVGCAISIPAFAAVTAVPSTLSCASSSMLGSGQDTCTLTLSTAAPTGGVSVSLSSSSTAVTVPASVTVPAGATNAAFAAAVASVSTAQTVTLTATGGGSSANSTVQLKAATAKLSVSATSLAFGSVTTVSMVETQTVTLTSSGTVGVTINSATITGSGFTFSGVAFPTTLNPGQTVTLNVGYAPTVAGAVSGQLAISNSGSTTTISLSGTGTPGVSKVACSNSTLTGPGTDSCTVTLNAAAASGGQKVTLSGSNSAVTLPTSVTVPANAISVAFNATVAAVSTTQSAVITATSGYSLSSGVITLASGGTRSLSVNSTSVAYGDVAANSVSTQSVILTSTGTAPITVSSAAVSGSAFSLVGGTLPVTLNPGQSIALDVQFEPTSPGTISGTATITSNSTVSPTVTISLNGTCDPHRVQLSWDAPASSSDAVFGYHVYRAPAGSTAFQLLDSGNETGTMYLDATVESGITYTYLVASVDSAGIESEPSNAFTVAVP